MANRKPTFFMSRYVMDVFYAFLVFPTLGWNWKKDSPPVHIYCSDMWEDNFVPWVYEICNLFLRFMYHRIFKADAPTFSQRAKALITLHGDWYGGEYFSYIEFGAAI